MPESSSDSITRGFDRDHKYQARPRKCHSLFTPIRGTKTPFQKQFSLTPKGCWNLGVSHLCHHLLRLLVPTIMFLAFILQSSAVQKSPSAEPQIFLFAVLGHLRKIEPENADGRFSGQQ